MVEEEEIREQGEAQEEEVDGNKDRILILMCVGFVANMVTMQMIVTKGLIIEDLVEEISKEIICLHQTMVVFICYAAYGGVIADDVGSNDVGMLT